MTEPRYRPIERLAAGGMAEVFLAEATSVQGFKKRVAIKRVLPHLAQNKNFIGMFLDEARLGARMSHANCVTVFDIGAADNTYFIVMEFVDGCDLKSVIEYFRKSDKPVPVKESIHIAMEACRGLQYAHDLTDDDGEHLEIVHRDISPPNVLISKRGEVKVTDFGLAKASTQLEKTDPGVVKGKFSYLAPEAVNGETVDARADVFAMGVVLWEMVAGRRLFLGDNDYETVKLVQAATLPSLREINKDVEPAFEAILAKSLAKHVGDRYQSAREFGDALAGYLFGHGLKVTSYDIAAIVKAAITDAQANKPKQSNAASIIDKLIQEELLLFTSIDSHTEDLFEGDREVARPDGSQPLDVGQFVDPASWFGDDDLGGGLDSSDSIPILVGESARPLAQANAPGALAAPVASVEGVRAAAASSPSASTTKTSSGGGNNRWVAIVVALVVVAAGLAFALK